MVVWSYPASKLPTRRQRPIPECRSSAAKPVLGRSPAESRPVSRSVSSRKLDGTRWVDVPPRQVTGGSGTGLSRGARGLSGGLGLIICSSYFSAGPPEQPSKHNRTVRILVALAGPNAMARLRVKVQERSRGGICFRVVTAVTNPIGRPDRLSSGRNVAGQLQRIDGGSRRGSDVFLSRTAPYHACRSRRGLRSRSTGIAPRWHGTIR